MGEGGGECRETSEVPNENETLLGGVFVSVSAGGEEGDESRERILSLSLSDGIGFQGFLLASSRREELG